MNNINLIFDFDGTLVDSFHIVIQKFNVLASEFNFRYVTDNEIDKLKNLSSRALIKYLNIPLYKIPAVLIKARELMREETQTLPIFPNLRDVLQTMKDMDIKLSILTSNSSENVIAWLRHNDMENFFNFIHGESNFFGKKQLLKKMIKSYKMNKAETFYIGDEVRDIEAAKKCNIKSIAVTWGFNTEKILSQYQPHFIVKSPEDLLTIFYEIKINQEDRK